MGRLYTYASAAFEGGLGMNPDGPLTESDIAEARSEGSLTDIGLHDSCGFDGQGVELLASIPDLFGLRIRTMHPIDLDVVNRLTSLRVLHIEAPRAAGEVDFPSLPHLRDAKVAWHPSVASVADAEQLDEVEVDSYRGPDLRRFSAWHGVRHFNLLRPKVHSMAGVEAWRSARSLLVFEGRSVKDWSPLAGLTGLRGLHLERIRNLGDVEFVRKMPELRRLMLDNCGEFASLDPLRDLKDLELLRVNEGCRISDGRVGWLTALPSLTQVNVAPYRKGPPNDRGAAELSRDIAALGRPPLSDDYTPPFLEWRDWVASGSQPAASD